MVSPVKTSHKVFPRVDELFEARDPKGQAYLSEISGVASLWEAGDDYVVQVVSSSEAVERLPLDGRVAKALQE